MESFLYIVFFVSCVLLVASVLLQPGKTDAGALFTSNISSAAMNPRGTQSVLSKMTIVLASVFMLTALLLSLPAITGNVSVLETQGNQQTAPQTEAGNTSENTNAPAANSDPDANKSTGNTAEVPASGNEKGEGKSPAKNSAPDK